MLWSRRVVAYDRYTCVLRLFCLSFLFCSPLDYCSSVLRLLSGEYRCLSRNCWIMSKMISTIIMVVDLSAPVSILNPNLMYLPLPLLGVPYLNQNVPLLMSYNIITFLVFYTISPYCCMVRWHYYRIPLALLSNYVHCFWSVLV